MNLGRIVTRSHAREILRVNGYASLVWAPLLFASIFPGAHRAGLSRLAVAGFAVAVLLAGGDQLFLALGRRLRRLHLVPFAVLNAACSAACVALLNRGLAVGAGLAAGSAAVLFAVFAILEVRAARSL